MEGTGFRSLSGRLIQQVRHEVFLPKCMIGPRILASNTKVCAKVLKELCRRRMQEVLPVLFTLHQAVPSGEVHSRIFSSSRPVHWLQREERQHQGCHPSSLEM